MEPTNTTKRPYIKKTPEQRRELKQRRLDKLIRRIDSYDKRVALIMEKIGILRVRAQRLTNVLALTK